MTEAVRSQAYGQGYRLTPVDKFGLWLSTRKLRAVLPSLKGLKIADVGCGYNASFVRSVLADVGRATVVDVALADDLKQNGKLQAIEGALPDALRAVPDGALDLVLCNNVIEHLWEPLATLREVHRIMAPGGCAFVNVPSWRGKWFLEFSAFRLGTSPPSEMNDHKMYYDPKDLWPLLVRAGFIPQNIRIGTHKFGLNSYAVCRV